VGGGSSLPPALQTSQPSFENMKTQINAKSTPNTNNPSGFRSGGIRPPTAKSFEHRYERRKIREQLRRLDWALNTD